MIELVIYDRHGNAKYRIPMTQDEDDVTKWHLDGLFMLDSTLGEEAYIEGDGREPQQLPRSLMPNNTPINTLFMVPTEAAEDLAAQMAAANELERTTNRWAAFSDDELDTLEGELPRTSNLKPFLEQIQAEIERRAT